MRNSASKDSEKGEGSSDLTVVERVEMGRSSPTAVRIAAVLSNGDPIHGGALRPAVRFAAVLGWNFRVFHTRDDRLSVDLPPIELTRVAHEYYIAI